MSHPKIYSFSVLTAYLKLQENVRYVRYTPAIYTPFYTSN